MLCISEGLINETMCDMLKKVNHFGRWAGWGQSYIWAELEAITQQNPCFLLICLKLSNVKSGHNLDG